MTTGTSVVKCAVEGLVDQVVLQRILLDLGIPCGEFYVKNGKRQLLSRLPNYNLSARHLTWVILLDLDDSAECAPAYVRSLLPNQERGMHLRIAVRAVEAWLLADAERLAAFLGIPVSMIPANPDMETDPKATIINLARRSRRRDVREGMVPPPRSGRREGPAYRAYITEFLASGPQAWRPRVASQHSTSLSHCLAALDALRDSL